MAPGERAIAAWLVQASASNKSLLGRRQLRDMDGPSIGIDMHENHHVLTFVSGQSIWIADTI